MLPTYLFISWDSLGQIGMGLDNDQNHIGGPAHKTHGNTQTQEQSIVRMVVRQAFQSKVNQGFAQGHLQADKTFQ